MEAAAIALGAAPTLAETTVKFPLSDGPYDRRITTDFPPKGAIVLRRTRPPLLETPFDVFDKSLFTPNDRFFVRWHWAAIPQAIDVANHGITVRGHVRDAGNCRNDQRALHPPNNVETVDPTRLHLGGEFAESNLRYSRRSGRISHGACRLISIVKGLVSAATSLE